MTEKTVLEVKDLCKSYASFKLSNVSFTLQKGTITGFIGRNGAGKTTTLRCLLDLVHPDSGQILFFGRAYLSDPAGIRQDVGFASGEVSYYPHQTLNKLAKIFARFYTNWDQAMYLSFLDEFSLDSRKTPQELSTGMKVKYSIAIALSHQASLLILDEPTSGLDPASRADLLEVFLELVESKKVTILFSTQITSDLEDYADRIIYIQDGCIAADSNLNEYLHRFQIVSLDRCPEVSEQILGVRRIRTGWNVLMEAGTPIPAGGIPMPVSLQEIMILLHR